MKIQGFWATGSDQGIGPLFSTPRMKYITRILSVQMPGSAAIFMKGNIPITTNYVFSLLALAKISEIFQVIINGEAGYF